MKILLLAIFPVSLPWSWIDFSLVVAVLLPVLIKTEYDRLTVHTLLPSKKSCRVVIERYFQEFFCIHSAERPKSFTSELRRSWIAKRDLDTAVRVRDAHSLVGHSKNNTRKDIVAGFKNQLTLSLYKKDLGDMISIESPLIAVTWFSFCLLPIFFYLIVIIHQPFN